MKEYSYSEIGMLAGAAVGGGLAVAGYTLWDNVLFFAAVAICIAIGVSIGKVIDKNQTKNQ